MKTLITLLLVCLCSLSALAQGSDRQEWKDLERWGKNGSRPHPQGEEIKLMIKEAEQRGRPPLKPVVPVLSNIDVMRMKAAGFSDAIIIRTIKSQKSLFDTAPETLIEMKQLGVSETVISAILDVVHGAPGTINTPGASLVTQDERGLPTEMGVYYREKGQLLEIEAEPISWKSGGNLKSAFAKTGAIVATVIFPPAFPILFFTPKGHVNAKVMGAHSRFTIARDADLIIRTPEGVTPSEYLLVQLYGKDDRREFRFLTGGVLHRSSGAERTAQPFTYTKIAARTFAVKLSGLAGGEYGFLPTNQMSNTNAAFVGKLYSFTID